MTEGNKQATMPIAQAVMRSMAVNAVKGNLRAQRLFTEVLAATESANKNAQLQLLQSAHEYKAMYEVEIARCRHYGLERPSLLPHPDDIEIDPRTGEVSINGPMNPQEKKR